MDFEQFRAERARLIENTCQTSKAWRAIEGVGSGAMGLTPDSVKASPEYRRARAEFNAAMRALQAFNARHLKRFKAQIAAEQRAARASREGIAA